MHGIARSGRGASEEERDRAEREQNEELLHGVVPPHFVTLKVTAAGADEV
jgi:hypothetical protein